MKFKTVRSTVILFLIMFLSVPVLSYALDEKALEEKMQALQMRLEMLEQTQDTTATSAKGESKFYFGAFGSMEYKAFEAETNTFDGHRIELFFGANLTEKLKIHGLIEYEGASHTEYLASSGVTSYSGEVKTEEAYIQFDAERWCKVRLGTFYVPFGYYNQNNHDPYQPFTELPIVMRRVWPSEYSDTGINTMGTIDLHNKLAMDYSFAVVNGLASRDSANTISATTDGLRKARPSLRKDNNQNKALVGRLGWTFDDKYVLGVSGYSGTYDNDSKYHAKACGVDARIPIPVIDGLSMEGEYVYIDLEDGLNASSQSVPSKLFGFYARANYAFWPQALSNTILGRWSKTPQFSLHYEYGEAEIDQRYSTVKDLKEYRHTIGFNYRPHPNIVFKNEYQFNEGDIEHGNHDGYVFSIAFIFP